MGPYRIYFPRKLLYEIRRRPGMYLFPAESFSSLVTFINGFAMGCQHMTDVHTLPTPDSIPILKLEDNFLGFFSLWCQRKYDIGSAMLGYWTAPSWHGGNDDKKSFHAFFQILDDFEADLQRQGEDIAIADLLNWQKAQAE